MTFTTSEVLFYIWLVGFSFLLGASRDATGKVPPGWPAFIFWPAFPLLLGVIWVSRKVAGWYLRYRNPIQYDAEKESR